jgi:hypothetical protein
MFLFLKELFTPRPKVVKNNKIYTDNFTQREDNTKKDETLRRFQEQIDILKKQLELHA